MKTALDTNILSGLITQNPFTLQIVQHLTACQAEGPLLISGIVFAELLAHPQVTLSYLQEMLASTSIAVDFDLTQSVWIEAGKRFARHSLRRQNALKQGPRRIIADFLIGAHALATADRLLTFDTKVYRQNFASSQSSSVAPNQRSSPCNPTSSPLPAKLPLWTSL